MTVTRARCAERAGGEPFLRAGMWRGRRTTERASVRAMRSSQASGSVLDMVYALVDMRGENRAANKGRGLATVEGRAEGKGRRTILRPCAALRAGENSREGLVNGR